MVNVYDVKVRFMRRMQVREYEPVESEITISAQLTESDDYKDISQDLLLNAKELVNSTLTGKPVGKTETKTTKTKVSAAKKSSSTTEIPEDNISASEIPGDDEPAVLSSAEEKKVLAAEKRKVAAEKRKVIAAKKKAAADEIKKKAAADEIPGDEETPSDDDGGEELSANKLHEYINSMVTSRKVKPKQIKAIIAEYGAVRISDIPEENRIDVKEAIELLAG